MLNIAMKLMLLVQPCKYFDLALTSIHYAAGLLSAGI